MIDERTRRAMYQRVFFGTADGKAVLADILKDLDLKAIVDVDDQGKAALKNFAWNLLYKLGPGKAGYESLVDALARIPIQEE